MKLPELELDEREWTQLMLRMKGSRLKDWNLQDMERRIGAKIGREYYRVRRMQGGLVAKAETPAFPVIDETEDF